MGLFSKKRSRDAPETRTAPSKEMQEFIRGVDVDYVGNSSAGVRVDEMRAMQTSAVYACVKILAETIASLPLHLYKKGKGGKITALKFNIEKNTDYIDQLTLEEFLEDYGEGEVTDPKEMNIITKDYLEFISSACDDEFDEPQLQLIWTLLIDIIPLSCSAASGSELNDFARYDFLQKKYAELNVRAARKDLPPLKSRFGYFKEMLERVLIDRENNKANR